MEKRIINIKRMILLLTVVFLFPLFAAAQIGYQVSLLNSATGQPRANENVKVKIKITNSDNTVICSEEKDATSNEFGVLSLSIGNDKTFEDVDWTKAPFYVSATIDGVLIGKSQILSVPIAEAAKTVVGVSREVLEGKWGFTKTVYDEFSDTFITIDGYLIFKFIDNYSGIVTMGYTDEEPLTFLFDLMGNTIWAFGQDGVQERLLYHKGVIYDDHDSYTKQ